MNRKTQLLIAAMAAVALAYLGKNVIKLFANSTEIMVARPQVPGAQHDDGGTAY